MFVYVFVEVLDSNFWVMGVLIGVWAWVWPWLFWLGVTGCGCGGGIVGFFAIGGMFAFCSLNQNLAPTFTTLQRIIPRGLRVEALIKFILEQVIHYYTFLQKLFLSNSDSKPFILVSCFLPTCLFLLMKLFFFHRFTLSFSFFARNLFMYQNIVNPINNHICLLYCSN